MLELEKRCEQWRIYKSEKGAVPRNTFQAYIFKGVEILA